MESNFVDLQKRVFKWQVLVGIGLAAGVVITAVDNFAFEGEVSPIIIVAMLFVATAASRARWGWRGWFMAAPAWLCVPLAHLIKQFLGLPDTLNPNTYTSILMLAAFTLAVAAIGVASGVFIRRITRVVTKKDS